MLHDVRVERINLKAVKFNIKKEEKIRFIRDRRFTSFLSTMNVVSSEENLGISMSV